MDDLKLNVGDQFVALLEEANQAYKQNEELTAYIQELGALEKDIKDVKLHTQYQLLRVKWHRKNNRLEEAEREARALKRITDELDDLEIKLETVFEFREIFDAKSRYDESLSMMLPYLDIDYKDRRDLKVQLLNSIALIYSFVRDNDKSIHFMRLSADLARELPDYKEMDRILNNLAGTLWNLKKSPEALPIFLEAIKHSETHGKSERMRLYMAMNVMYINSDLGDFDECIRFHDEYYSTLVHTKEIREPELSELQGHVFSHVYVRCLENPNLTGSQALMDRIDIDEILGRFEHYYLKGDFSDGYMLRMLPDLIQYAYLSKNIEALKRYYDWSTATHQSHFERDKIKAINELTLKYELSEKEKTIQMELERKKELEQIVAERTEELQHKNKLLEQFAFIVAHDLKEPLRNINSFSQLLGRTLKGGESQQQTDYLGFIQKGANKINELLSDLLRFVTVGASKETDYEHFEVTEVLQGIVEDYQSEIERAGATLEIGEMPKIFFYKNYMQSILQNLISNALKYRSKTEDCKIKINYQQEGEMHLFQVCDNGIGIAEEYKEKVFQVFQRINKHEYEGTGIGLAICQKIINSHGGKIWVASKKEYPNGTCFCFMLPTS